MAAAESESQDDFEDTPEGWAKRWEKEMEAADSFLKDFREQAEGSLKAYLNVRKKTDSGTKRRTQLAIYWRNTQVMRALMYGRTPTVEVSRKFGDPNDNIARLAAEIQERALNCDIEREGKSGYATAMGEALDDRLPTGLGVARVRYTMEEEETPGKPALVDDEGEELAEAVPEVSEKKSEDVAVDYIHWRDFAYSPCRVWAERRWVGFRNEMTRKGLKERFVPSLMDLKAMDEPSARLVVERIPLNAKKAGEEGITRSGQGMDARAKDPWQRAEVWEIWDGESRRVFWWVKGFDQILDMKEDPYQLKEFFPCSKPMMANTTNDSFVAKPDYAMLEDLYTEIDAVSTRITELQRAIRVVGLYDETAGDLKTLTAGGPNQMFPIKNWMRWAEKGGAAGQIDWMPLQPITEALAQLRDYRIELMSQADQMSGMSDIMRGESSVQSATATEQGIKAKFASVRMGALQDEFAGFCSDIQCLKGELMALHFDVDTYVQKSNILQTYDGQNPQDILQAIALIKSNYADYRIEVKPEAVAMQDFAQMKNERTEVIQGIAQFLTSAAPLVQQMPGSSTFLGELLKWLISGLRGSRAIEGELDKVLAQAAQQQKQAALQPGAPPPPDPKMQAAQLKLQSDAAKSQADMQKEQFKLQASLQTIAAQTESKDRQEQSQAHWNTQEALAKHLIQGPKPMSPMTAPVPGPGGGM